MLHSYCKGVKTLTYVGSSLPFLRPCGVLSGRSASVPRASGGADEVNGGVGADTVYGNAGNDYLFDAPDGDRDVLYGGSGRDNVQVRDFPAVGDVVYCGGGRDTAYVDRLDEVHGCEVVRLP
jgi:Ca2+-binding RTX toxin-like protein